jgi:hypothetical protein
LYSELLGHDSQYDWPIFVWYFPIVHTSQSTAFVAAEYFPGGHAEHDEFIRFMKVPGTQAVQKPSIAPPQAARSPARQPAHLAQLALLTLA